MPLSRFCELSPERFQAEMNVINPAMFDGHWDVLDDRRAFQKMLDLGGVGANPYGLDHFDILSEARTINKIDVVIDD